MHVVLALTAAILMRGTSAMGDLPVQDCATPQRMSGEALATLQRGFRLPREYAAGRTTSRVTQTRTASMGTCVRRLSLLIHAMSWENGREPSGIRRLQVLQEIGGLYYPLLTRTFAPNASGSPHYFTFVPSVDGAVRFGIGVGVSEDPAEDRWSLADSVWVPTSGGVFAHLPVSDPRWGALDQDLYWLEPDYRWDAPDAVGKPVSFMTRPAFLAAVRESRVRFGRVEEVPWRSVGGTSIRPDPSLRRSQSGPLIRLGPFIQCPVSSWMADLRELAARFAPPDTHFDWVCPSLSRGHSVPSF